MSWPYVEDRDGMGRRWRWRLSAGLYHRSVGISYELCLIRMDGMERKPHPVEGWTLGLSLPSEWKIGAFHTWYDGPNCSWWFGPVWLSRHGRPCRECERDEDDSSTGSNT